MANKSSFPWGKWLGFLIVVGAVIAGGFWYFRRNDARGPQYETKPVARGALTQMVTASGQLNPVLSVQVGSQISGRIKAIYVDYNSVVKSNQVIAEIDPSTYQVAVLKVEAQLSNSMANLELAQVQARRADSLYASKLIADSDHDTAHAQLQQAEAQVAIDKANLESAKVDLSRCTIYAPVDGVVISRNVDVGQTVAASFNTPTLFLIANDLTKMQIDALISETDIGGVKVGQEANFSVDAYPYRTFHGKVSQIRYGAQTNQSVVNYDTIIDVNNSDMKLLPGMTANVSIITAQRDNVLEVPDAALRFHPPEGALVDTNAGVSPTLVAQNDGPAGRPGARRGGEGRGGPRQRGFRRGGSNAEPAAPVPRHTVYVLKASKDPGNSELVPVEVTTGLDDGLNTQIVEGLKEGDAVVTGIALPTAAGSERMNNPFSGRFGRRFR